MQRKVANDFEKYFVATTAPKIGISPPEAMPKILWIIYSSIGLGATATTNKQIPALVYGV